MKKLILGIAAAVLVLSLSPGVALAQDHGGGGGGCGDVFGDLIHIRRDPISGQAILEKRQVLLPQDVLGYAYCPIPVTASGAEIPLVDLSCDVDPAYLDQVVELDYFGRLSAGRTKERNLRMHFDEVIEKIKMAQAVSRDVAGRIKLGYGCTVVDGEPEFASCTEWDEVDSPLENLSLYHRVMKYGHIQTDPGEVDTWAHGDPATLPQYHVALAKEDWAKFDEPLRRLLPVRPGNPAAADACFANVVACVAPQVLETQDFPLAASFLGAAADKHGQVTVDLVQYINRILRITCGDTGPTKAWCTKPTESAMTPLNSVPALIRDCYDPATGAPGASCRIYPADQPVSTFEGTVIPAASGFPANERFVQFGSTPRGTGGEQKVVPATYDRKDWFGATYRGLQPVPATGSMQWAVGDTYMLDYLAFANADAAEGSDVTGFVNAAKDAVRTVEFVHEYAVPVNLLGYFPE